MICNQPEWRRFDFDIDGDDEAGLGIGVNDFSDEVIDDFRLFVDAGDEIVDSWGVEFIANTDVVEVNNWDEEVGVEIDKDLFGATIRFQKHCSILLSFAWYIFYL